MTVFVRYSVPVVAEIDLASGRVVRVQVDDERVSGPSEVFSVGEPDLEAAEGRRAAEVAEHEAWPQW